MAVKGVSGSLIITCKEEVSLARSKDSIFLPGKDISAREGFPCKGWVYREDYFCQERVSLPRKSFTSNGGFPCQGRVSMQGKVLPAREGFPTRDGFPC